jgi:phosphoribosyl 1,2-cyclic phosphodiesterase
MREGAIQRVGECHCGALKVIAAGEPERVYLCHCEESMHHWLELPSVTKHHRQGRSSAAS